MENGIVTIEYKKFSSFLKDYIKSLSQGFLFLLSDEEHSVGEFFSFSIKVCGFGKPLSAAGTVIYAGNNDSGEKGLGIEFAFDEGSKKYISEKLPEIVVEKYGKPCADKLVSLLGKKYNV
ncbi:hypothetical protein J5690_07520 [bacterium]|nr:hypothetical protein [bacterium]